MSDQDQTEFLYMPDGTVGLSVPGDSPALIPLPISNSSMVAAGMVVPGHFMSCQDHSGQAVALATVANQYYPPVDQRIGVMECNHNQLQQAHDALVIRSAILEQELSTMRADYERLLADFERLRDFLVLHNPVMVGPEARLTLIPMSEFRVGTWDGSDYHTWSCKCEFHHKRTVGVCAMCSYQRPSRPK